MFLKDEFGCGVVNRVRSEGLDWRQRGEEQTKSDGDLNQAQSRGGGENKTKQNRSPAWICGTLY